MLIDDFMPTFEFSDSQKTDVKATPEAAFRAFRTFDMAESMTIRWLFKMRGIPTNNLTLRDLERVNFKVLGERQSEELVLGLAGEFKTLLGGLLNLSPEQFKAFNNPGFIKACWNFAVADLGNGKGRVTSEIRIHGTDAASVAKVKNVWGMLKMPSAMVRNEILKLIKKQAEREVKGT
ncbi:MAG: hypothetical protein M3209_19120 [Acidobacteriota bacterium]|nr:hypothetical protein [Acidobacteriota bacterium]